VTQFKKTADLDTINTFVVNYNENPLVNMQVQHSNFMHEFFPSVDECFNQQTLGIIVFAYPLVFELQLLLDFAVTKEFTNDICSVNMPSLSSTKAYTED